MSKQNVHIKVKGANVSHVGFGAFFSETKKKKTHFRHCLEEQCTLIEQLSVENKT